MTTATVVKRGPGRPKGSKNKPKTTDTTATAPVVKRGPGRPRKNPEAVTATAPAVKRGPGRPRKNPESVAAPVKRGPGRPKGSKNKPKTTATVTVTATAPVKRGPGRPRKNPESLTPPVLKRGPGRPRKNPEVTATITATSKTASKASANTRQVLVNPFKAGDVVNIPAGSVFTSAAPTLKGRQKVKRGHKVTLVGTIPAHVQPRNSETGSKVLIRPARLRAKGSGNYWKDITLTEKILKFNGLNATYETVNVEAATTSAPVAEPAPNATVSEPTESNAHEPMFSASI
jgi:hypothetical protein